MGITLVVVGACYLDTILDVPYFPEENDKLRATSQTKRRGGNGPNSLQVLQQLVSKEKISLALCSVLPSPESVDCHQIIRSLSPQIDVSTCIYREKYQEAASSYIISSTATASRTIVNYNNLPEMGLDEFAAVCASLDSSNAWYHFEGRIPEVSLACMRHLRDNYPSATISVELEKPGRAGLEELAAEADVVFIAHHWAMSKRYGTATACVMAQTEIAKNASLLFCTWGPAGSVALRRSDSAIFKSQAFPVAICDAIDTTGAGDTYIAGILFCLMRYLVDGKTAAERLSQLNIPDTLSFANEIAGRKVMQKGFDDLGPAMLPRIQGGKQTWVSIPGCTL